MSNAAGTILAALASSELRVAVVLLTGWLGARLLASSSAAVRHGVWTATVVGVLAVPAAHLLLPAVRTPFTTPMAAWIGRTFARKLVAPREPPVGTVFNDEERVAQSPQSRGRDTIAPTLVRDEAASLLIALWLAGAIAVAARMAATNTRARRIVRAASPVTDAFLLQLTADLAVHAGLSYPPPLLETSALAAPATFGVAHRVVLLPVDRTWTAESDEARVVLLHELAHVARRDCLTHALMQLACALHWFNPLIWLAERRARAERERACDDRVLVAGVVADDYAALLVAVVRAARRSTPIPASVIAMARPAELETRLIAILEPSQRRHALGRGSARILIAVAAVTVAATGAVRLDAAPVQRVNLDRPRAQTRGTEPDTRGDSVSLPSSERIDPTSIAVALSRSRAALNGPDSILARSLRAALDHSSNGPADLVRERAAWALAQTSEGLLVEPLIRSLGDESWRVRAYAAWSLGVARDARAVPPLLVQLRDPVWRMRAMAAFALADIGDARARSAMEALQADEAWQVRVSVVRYFRAFSDDSATTLVRHALTDRHMAVRAAASGE